MHCTAGGYGAAAGVATAQYAWSDPNGQVDAAAQPDPSAAAAPVSGKGNRRRTMLKQLHVDDNELPEDVAKTPLTDFQGTREWRWCERERCRSRCCAHASAALRLHSLCHQCAT